MSIVVGIDPGLTGGIAFLGSSGIDIHDMPVAPNAKGKLELDLFGLGSLLVPRSTNRNIAILEQVHAMPGQGVSSVFRFGQGYGALQMAVIGHGYEVHYVPPATWKKYFGLSKDKGVSRGMASRRFPQAAHHFTRVKDDGRAEAALIALYATDKFLSGLPTHT